MRIFIDTANIEEIEEIHSMGFLSGVTTNPTLLAREKKEYKTVVRDICSLVKGPVSVEVLSLEHDHMVAEGKELARIDPNIVIKVPLMEEGLKTIRTLADLNIKTNATLIFSANQALLAARAGATYVSPFIGRLDDIGNSGLTVLAEIIEIIDLHGLETEVIAASIRHPIHVLESARMGSHIATIPYSIIKQMIRHPLTDAGVEKFLQDWKQVF